MQGRVVSSSRTSYRYHWVENGRNVAARPFYLLQPSGERTRVEPDSRTLLVDKLEPREKGLERRTLVAELVAGETVHVMGVLVRAPDPMQAGYREAELAWVLRPPARGRMLVATEPLEERDLRRAAFHLGYAKGFAFSFALVQVCMAWFNLHRLTGHGLERFSLEHDVWPSCVAICATGIAVLMGMFYLYWGRNRDWFEQRRIRYTEDQYDDPFHAQWREARDARRAEERARFQARVEEEKLRVTRANRTPRRPPSPKLSGRGKKR